MTIRIDTARNRLDATIALLAILRGEIEDLHVLAYERHVTPRQKVNGGTHDYALDTHGNPQAREMYRYISDLTLAAAELLAEAAHDAQKFMRTGERQPRTRRTVTADEVREALDARDRRQARGEYTPWRIYPQPRPGT